MSYGGSGSSSASQRAYQAAYQSGMVMVAATGNSGARTPIGYPAAYDTTIAVGATDSNDRIANFSQRGRQIDVVAPGVNVVSARVGGGTRSLSGTSMATPHVAGAAAAILSENPRLSIEQVRSILRETADDLGASGFDTTYGAGRINVRRAIASLGGGGGPVNRPPVAAFTFSTSGLQVDFDENASDPDGFIASYRWNFGDGYGSTSASPSHTYSSAGTYTVTLEVTDDDGASRSTSQRVTVESGSSADIEIAVRSGGFWIWTYDDISWRGARTNSVDIYRNNQFLTQTANDGSYRVNTRGSSGATYIVCEAGSTTVCSDPASN